MKKRSILTGARRALAFVLCLSLIFPILPTKWLPCGLVLQVYAKEGAGKTEKIVEKTRVADPDTMDDYENRLITTKDGSRYAGRVWTDKSVFAFGDSARKNDDDDKNFSHFNGENTLTLAMNHDGYNGDVKFNADFAHVFSALASSQVVNEYPPTPVDLVIVFDMSGSMGQDTRYSIDTGLNIHVPHDTSKDVDAAGNTLEGDKAWPAVGVPMAERIANSRIQKTLDAINTTIDKLMAQNPQNRVAVCGYGANAVVLMPLGHYQHADINNDGSPDANAPYLSVGGMETLYHPSDLVYRTPGDTVMQGNTRLPAVSKAGWYWMNNRDTCYTVVVNAEYNTYTGVLNDNGDGAGQSGASVTDVWTDVKKTVSNNVRTDDGTPVKAFPGVENWENGEPTATYGELSQTVYKNTSSNVAGWASGLQGVLDSKTEQGTDLQDSEGKRTSYFKEAMKPTSGLKADDYVGYFTNTQGGIYLAYKQLADSTATTYTEELSNGVMSTVARIPAAIIMSDGGANFSFNEMGQDGVSYTAEYWNARYGQRIYSNEALTYDYISDDTWTSGNSSRWKEGFVDGRYKDAKHRLGGIIQDDIEQDGDEWYKVFIPGKDTLGSGWDGLHGLYNQGADIFEDGTLSSPPAWNHAGIFYSSDNNVTGTAGTVMEVLLTASYMSSVVQKHYSNGWTTNDATEESKSELFTYTMNVDTKHVPLWGRMRLYPTLDPKDYNLNDIETWYKDEANNDKFGTDEEIQGTLDANSYLAKDKITKELLFDGGEIPELDSKTVQVGEETNTLTDTTGKDDITGLKQAWVAFSHGKETKGPNQINSDGAPINIAIKPIPIGGVAYTAGGEDEITVTNDDVVANIAYNDEFFDVTSEQMGSTFDRILALILGNVFVPVSGDNDAGVGDSITYQDPIGEYMEVKNGAINVTPYHVGELPKDEADYDMALLLFGSMHGIVRTGVYDYQWNDKWMEKHTEAGIPGTTPFEQGWYKGEDPEIALSGGPGAVPAGDGVGPYKDANDARAAGWIYRLNYETVQEYVPILSEVSSPEELSDQAKHTVYTIYRFAGEAKDRNALHRNPIYGEIPQNIQEKWDAYVKEHGYPKDTYADVGIDATETPGLYRLSDIRVWVEDTGDYVDTDGKIVPNTGYDRSLYVNIPAAAVPTELVTITLGRDGVLSYETNLGSDHEIDTYYGTDAEGEPIKVTQKVYENFCYQSTPFRLFYAVGLEDDLILRDAEGNQQGVDFNKISPEYIQSHTVEGQDYVWFISNYYSETRYDEYTTDNLSRTRGDPTVTFSPSADNRYYVFQKPLPLYAHAYKPDGSGGLKAVDRLDDAMWDDTDHRGGNGNTVWEDGATGGGSWLGGQYMGLYESAEKFQEAFNAMSASGYITDSQGIKYKYEGNGIVFLEDDMLDHVTSNAKGEYTDGSVSFSSDDYFFILVEYYMPDEGVGVDDKGNVVPGTSKGHMVQYALARKGSEFGSGFASENIDNGDMLCWTDTNDKLNVEFAYVSKTDTGDLTRGEPTFEKLTLTSDNLIQHLQNVCGIKDPDKTEITITNERGEQEKISILAYWLKMQADPLVQAALKAADSNANDALSKDEFEKAFKFAVAARPGGVRSGDMSNNVQYKGTSYNADTALYDKNVTETSNTYYLPTISDRSGTDNNVIISNYLGNNGRLEIANQMLHVTKMISPPKGYTLTENQLNKEFDYQIFVQGVSGTRSAVRTEYNEYSKNWERELAYIDVLTDNSGLVQTNNSVRALFVQSEVEGSGDGKVITAKQVVLGTKTNDEGKEVPWYYYADDEGNPTTDEAKATTEANLYYLYLPSDAETHTRRLYENEDYTNENHTGYDLEVTKNGMTTFVDEAHKDKVTNTDEGVDNRDSYRLEDGDLRPAGTKTYWAMDTVLIPVSEVQEAESGSTAEEVKQWTYEAENAKNHQKLTFFTFVIRKPAAETSMTNFTSPFLTRSAYMTKELEFGIDEGTLYDTIIPTMDRPDLFNDANNTGTNEEIANHTAKFTLKHGEGLLLTGLDNRITYRFTEKLTEKQLAQGYKLDQVSHIQQRGSESIYKLGIQEITIYTQPDSKYGKEYTPYQDSAIENDLTWQFTKEGNLNTAPEVTQSFEPFAHTNAIMWEYYATMAEDDSGNHHQPSTVTEKEKETTLQIWREGMPNTYDSYDVENTPHIVADNPSCKQVETVTQLKVGSCDLKQTDGSTLHYMYREGILIDPHYEGEASTYLRNMARYGVSPTVHFAVTEEEKIPNYATTPPGEYKGSEDYTGVYSVYGNTGWFEEQAHYINTIDPPAVTLTAQKMLENAELKADEFAFALQPWYWSETDFNLDKMPAIKGEFSTTGIREISAYEQPESVSLPYHLTVAMGTTDDGYHLFPFTYDFTMPDGSLNDGSFALRSGGKQSFTLPEGTAYTIELDDETMALGNRWTGVIGKDSGDVTIHIDIPSQKTETTPPETNGPDSPQNGGTSNPGEVPGEGNWPETEDPSVVVPGVVDGTPNDGTPNDGTPNDGTPNDGSPNDNTGSTDETGSTDGVIVGDVGDGAVEGEVVYGDVGDAGEVVAEEGIIGRYGSGEIRERTATAIVTLDAGQNVEGVVGGDDGVFGGIVEADTGSDPDSGMGNPESSIETGESGVLGDIGDTQTDGNTSMEGVVGGGGDNVDGGVAETTPSSDTSPDFGGGSASGTPEPPVESDEPDVPGETGTPQTSVGSWVTQYQSASRAATIAGNWSFTPDAGNQANEAPMPADTPAEPGKPYIVVKNGADGTVTFEDITFVHPGVAVYLIYELEGEEESITYDKSVYAVVVKVDGTKRGATEEDPWLKTIEYYQLYDAGGNLMPARPIGSKLGTKLDTITPLDFTNYNGPLPETGGIGTTMFYITGTALILCGVWIILPRRRRRVRR